MDLALNNVQWLMCHKTNQTKPSLSLSLSPNTFSGFPKLLKPQYKDLL